MTGSSNGGGAAWSMTAWYPEVFAAAVPLAGTGDTGAAAAIASRYTQVPIWTFHGDADTTLSVEGTRKLVEAIQAAGGEKIIYTEIAGGTHNIWKEAAATEGLIDWIFAQTNEHFQNTLPPQTEDPTDTSGMDINGDGIISLLDVLLLLKRGPADKANLEDVLRMLRHIVGTPDMTK